MQELQRFIAAAGAQDTTASSKASGDAALARRGPIPCGDGRVAAGLESSGEQERLDARREWRKQMGQSVRRLMLDTDLFCDEHLSPTTQDSLRCQHLDKMFSWFEEHSIKGPRPRKEGPDFIEFDPHSSVTAGSLRNPPPPSAFGAGPAFEHHPLASESIRLPALTPRKDEAVSESPTAQSPKAAVARTQRGERKATMCSGRKHTTDRAERWQAPT